MRVGVGYDIHQLAAGRHLVLGGVRISHDKGLVGHSDADVLVHSVCDAIFGAAGLGDIGRHFPDTDPAYKDISSMVLLKQTWQKARAKCTTIGNIDATIFAQQPKLADYTGEMAARIAEVLEIAPEQVNIKATTTEKLGIIGREAAIAAMCVVLLE
ncbi:MAG: 2-C-methyl-D-erythritol 2,4-cyclodiphosphate synthase [Desulfobacteraceae bacterium]|nr:2-C-methyl-D-erythritol 2,4-cyclodiphosphate synthase [Desulfobacteraceae bacterium]